MTEGFSRIDQELCTGCDNCTATCPADAISGQKYQPHAISEERCVSCGRCVQICNAYDSIFQKYPTPRDLRLKQRDLPPGFPEPLFAAYDRRFTSSVKAALADPGLVVMAQLGPAVCGPLAEDFGLPAGSLTEGRVVAALKKAGFRKVYSFSLPAAMAVLEEAHELVERLREGRILPVINSSCPAGVKFIEQSHPELIHYIAGNKSPHQIAGTLVKSRAAKMLQLSPERIYSVSIGPCNSRKFEASRPEMASGGRRDIDAVLTSRDLAHLIKDLGIDLSSMGEESHDHELPPLVGMDRVYGIPGDITEAVLKAGYGLLAPSAGQALEVQFTETETEGVRAASVKLDAFSVKAVALTGLPNAVPFLDAIKAGKSDIAFLEILACPMGCVSGGGQPKILLPQDKTAAYLERARLNGVPDARALHSLARNAEVQRIYRECFGRPCGNKSNHGIYTQYVERKLSQ